MPAALPPRTLRAMPIPSASDVAYASVTKGERRMPSCYLCAAQIGLGQAFRREVRTSSSWRRYYTRRGGSSYGETYGLRTLCSQCAAVVDHSRAGRWLRAFLAIGVAILGVGLAFAEKFEGDAGQLLLAFLIMGGPGWLTFWALEKLHMLSFAWRQADGSTSKVSKPDEPPAGTAEPVCTPVEGSPPLNDIQRLKAQAVTAAALRPDGRYTVPRSWGVYKLPCSAGFRPYRTGNHPVRHQELQREHGSVTTVALFLDQDLAKQFADLSNAQSGPVSVP